MVVATLATYNTETPLLIKSLIYIGMTWGVIIGLPAFFGFYLFDLHNNYWVIAVSLVVFGLLPFFSDWLSKFANWILFKSGREN